MSYRMLKPEHKTQKKIEALMKFLDAYGLQIEIAPNPTNGVIVWDSENDTAITLRDNDSGTAIEELPPIVEFKSVICDRGGNPEEF